MNSLLSSQHVYFCYVKISDTPKQSRAKTLGKFGSVLVIG